MAITLFLAALRYTTLMFATLFPIINPLGVTPIFLNLTSAYPEDIRKGKQPDAGQRGAHVLRYFASHRSDCLRVCAGEHRLEPVELGKQHHLGENQVGDGARCPAARLLSLDAAATVGPGCTSVAIAFGAHIRQQSTQNRIDNLAPFLRALFGMALVCVTLALCYQHAGRLAAFLGPSGTNIVVRLSAFLLLALGIQITWNGLTSLVNPLLARAAAP